VDRAGFWRLIGLVDQRALAQEREQDAVDPVTAVLVQLGAPAAIAFERHLTEVLHDIDGPAWAAATDEDWTPDSFLYARCYIVARGEAHYAAVLADPQRADSGEEYGCEALLFVASSAWSTNTGGDPDQFPHAKQSYETGSNPKYWT
jgi:hypothetical protein